MSTQAVADRLVELYNKGKAVEAEQELYSNDVVSYEQDGRIVKGLEGIIEKTKQAHGFFEEVHRSEITEVHVNNDSFLATFEMDFKPKGGERTQMREYGFYKVQNGKVSEEYFYMVP